MAAVLNTAAAVPGQVAAAPSTPEPYKDITAPRTPPGAVVVAKDEQQARLEAFRMKVRQQEVERLKQYFPGAFRKGMSSTRKFRSRFSPAVPTPAAQPSEPLVPEDHPVPEVHHPAFPLLESPSPEIPPSSIPKKKRKRSRPSKWKKLQWEQEYEEDYD